MQLINVLSANGAHYIPLRDSDGAIEDLLALTHIISTHVDFPQYHSALDHDVDVVKPSWVFQSMARSKLATARQHSPDPAQFFQDVVLTCAELPEGDKDAIIAGVIALGGQYSSPLTKLVTHIVTTDLENDKCKLAREKNLSCKIVLPHWFDFCFKLGKKISEEPDEFPDPQILQAIRTAPRGVTSSEDLEGAITASPSGVPTCRAPGTPPTSPSEPRKNLNALMGKKVLLSKDLDLSEHLRKTLDDLINYAGGTLTFDVAETDIYIGQYRDGADYVAASRASKEVANLSWLYHIINRNKYTNPLSKLLHYPVPRNGLPGFEHQKISISNYAGDSRIYLENLIKHCGAEFTKTMRQENTHLITAHKQSEKCEAAEEWNINVINHLWLEESYAKCAIQSLSNTRYTTFPARNNLSEVVGQTRLDMKRVETTFFPKPRVSPVKQLPPVDIQNLVRPSPRKTVPASSAAGAATPREKAQLTAPTPIAEDAETEDEEEAQPSTTKRPRGRPRKSDATPRHLDEEKENESPLLMSTGRASKAKALDVLHRQADDIALFAREMKRKGGVTHGGRRSSHAEDFSSPAPAPTGRKKRKSDEATYDATAEGSDLSDGETQAQAKSSKKAKRSSGAASLPPVQFKMMITGYERWLNTPRLEDSDKRKLRQLGVQLVQDAPVDILVAPRIMRTRKFVCALASAPMVVDTGYLDIALKENALPERPTLLKDSIESPVMGCKLSDALERAKVNQCKLLRGWHIYVTKDVAGGFETWKDIITVNGGAAYLYAGRTGLTLPKRRLREDPEAGSESQHQGGEDEFDYVYLGSGQTEPEMRLWKMFRDIARKQDLETRIVSKDWLLNAAMSQQVRWEEKWALDEAKTLSQRSG